MRGLRFLLLTITALSIFTVYLIVSTTDPNTISTQMRGLFYIAMFLTITCGVALIRATIHPVMRRTALESMPILSVLRQGAIVAIVIIALMLLQALRSMNWLEASLIIVAAILFELFFRVRIPVRTEKEAR